MCGSYEGTVRSSAFLKQWLNSTLTTTWEKVSIVNPQSFSLSHFKHCFYKGLGRGRQDFIVTSSNSSTMMWWYKYQSEEYKRWGTFLGFSVPQLQVAGLGLGADVSLPGVQY